MLFLQQLVDRVCNQSQRCTEIMRHTGKEGQLGMCSLFQLTRQCNQLVTLFLQLVTLLFQLLLLGRQFRIHPVLYPKGTYQEKEQESGQNQYYHTGI